MGGIGIKCFNIFDKNDKFDINRQKDDLTKKNEYISYSRKKKLLHKNNLYNINDIIIPSQSTNNNNNEGNNEINNYNMNISKIIKIQNNYHQRYLHNKFQTEISSALMKKTQDFIIKYNQKFLLQDNVIKNIEKFSPTGWVRYYPSNDSFFQFQKGEIYPEQFRIYNEQGIDNMEIYEGEMNSKNLKHGNGILTTSHYILRGTWREDEFTGWGIKCWRNGDTLEGRFVKGELNGKGIFRSGKSIYEGDFINGERNGIGDVKTEKYHYKGEFKNNKFNGKGEIEFFYDGQKYEGDFYENEIYGEGVYKWKNGDVYYGCMKNGKMDGFGKYIYNSGLIYEGEYIKNIKEGKGKLSYPDGKSYEGYFKNGELNGEVAVTDKNNNTQKILFSQGNFVKFL